MVSYAASFALIALLLIGQDLAIIQADIQQGKFGEARQLLSEEIRKHPQAPDAYNLLGICLTELKDPTLAAQAFQKGLRLAPDSISMLENMGLLLYRQADYTDAKRYLVKALSKGSQNIGARFSLAASKLRTGEQVSALADLKTLESVLAESSEYWEERGRAEAVSSAASADASFAKALALSPSSLPALDGAADAALRQGQEERALAILIRARQIDPDDAATTIRFAEVCIRRDLGIDAKDALEKLHKREPGNSAALFLLARANVSLQQWNQALQLFQEFTSGQPSYAPAYFALGWIDIQINKRTEARSELNRCLRLDPELLDARFELAQLQMDEGDMTAAESNLALLLKANPRHAKANAILADIRLRSGDLDGAQTCLQTAIEADPKLAAAHYRLSTILARRGQAEQASRERSLAATLAAEDKRETHTQLRLVTPASKEKE